MNGLFDQIAKRRCLLNPGSGAGAYVQFELAAIHGWEKILTQPGDQKRNRTSRHGKEHPQKNLPMLQADVQPLVIALAEAFESLFKTRLQPDQRIAARARQMSSF